MSASQCPACGAAVRTGAPWCLLCHLDLRPAPLPAAVAALAPAAGARPCPATAAPAWPCAVCGRDNALQAPACLGCGAPFLAGLASDAGPGAHRPALLAASRLSRSVRLALAAGAGLLAALVLTGVVLLAGTLL